MNNTIERDKSLLIPFLGNLVDSIKDEKLSADELERIGRFYMSYSFESELDKDSDMSKDFSKDELLKFLSLGYYIYVHILNKEE